MAKAEDLTKKVNRLKKKVADLKKKKGAESESEAVGAMARLWHKRLKRTQRRKKLIESETARMQGKKAKKKKGDEGKEAAKTGESAA
jgi:hypothetical protein